MSLAPENILELYEVAKLAAYEAGSFIGLSRGKSIKVEIKKQNLGLASQVVTEIDLKAQEIILTHLAPSIKKYDLGLLTEESIDDQSRFEKNHFWCIDPLDGTLQFFKNLPGYAVSIALVSRSGDVVLGVCYNPATKDLYHAIKGNGAFKNIKPFSISSNNEKLSIFSDHSYQSHKDYNKHIHNFGDVIAYRPFGAVINAIKTIEKSPGIYFKIPKEKHGGGSIWDFAATSIIHTEAGGFNADFHGNPLNFNSRESTFMNKYGIIYVPNIDFVKVIHQTLSL